MFVLAMCADCVKQIIGLEQFVDVCLCFFLLFYTEIKV